MKGRILFNGNAGSELLDRAAPFLRGAARGAPPKVLLVTAAWKEGEYNEGPVKEALYQLGITEPIHNSCVWHVWRDFLSRRPDVAAVWAETTEAMEAIQGYYLEKTAFHAELIRRGVRELRARVPEASLGALHTRDPLRPESQLSGRELFAKALSRELLGSIDDLKENDERMLAALDDAQDQVHARTGLRFDPEWLRARDQLQQRILGADALIFFGGSPTELLGALRFFDLQPALMESLRRGATFVVSSAGALVLCDRMIVYDNYAGDPLSRDFRLLDRGLGLVGGLQILPHCMDRIQTDDPDNLAYLARRFSSRVCAGLNEESYLLVELGGPVVTSVGRDGVYVFGPEGKKSRYNAGERISF